MHPNLLNDEIFAKDKNIAYSLIKEFFVKYSHEEITSEKMSNMLTEDCNNMFSSVR